MIKRKKLIIQLGFAVVILALWELYAISRNIMALPRLEVILQTLFEDMFVSDTRPILLYLGKSLTLIAEGLGIGHNHRRAIRRLCS